MNDPDQTVTFSIRENDGPSEDTWVDERTKGRRGTSHSRSCRDLYQPGIHRSSA